MKRKESKNAGDGEDVSFDGGGYGHVGEQSEMMMRAWVGFASKERGVGKFCATEMSLHLLAAG